MHLSIGTNVSHFVLMVQPFNYLDCNYFTWHVACFILQWLPLSFVLCAASSQSVSFDSILFFATGLRSMPPCGLDPKPSLEFHGSGSLYPKANTCSCVLSLPTLSTSFDMFVQDMNFGIENGQGFGFA